MQSEHLGQLRQLVVERFEGDRLRFKHFRHTIAGTEDVLEAEYDHGARRRAVYQAQLRLQPSTQVDSLPTSARATSKPCSGSS